MPLEGERKPWLVWAHGVDGQLSPDGHWLAYTSTETGSPEVYARHYYGIITLIEVLKGEQTEHPSDYDMIDYRRA